LTSILGWIHAGHFSIVPRQLMHEAHQKQELHNKKCLCLKLDFVIAFIVLFRISQQLQYMIEISYRTLFTGRRSAIRMYLFIDNHCFPLSHNLSHRKSHFLSYVNIAPSEAYPIYNTIYHQMIKSLEAIPQDSRSYLQLSLKLRLCIVLCVCNPCLY